MKLENIPADIKKKSIDEAKKEVAEILSELEQNDKNLEKSLDKYKRMLLLNTHIQKMFRDKISETNKTIKSEDLK